MTKTMIEADWRAAGRARYGEDTATWKFRCPVCGHVATAADWIDLEARDQIAISCVGRFYPKERQHEIGTINGRKQPCNYAGYGLFKLNPVHVIMRGEGQSGPYTLQAFDFADDPLVPKETPDARPAAD